MTTHHKSLPILPKFKKRDGICNICQKPGKMSDDHVPPKSCLPEKRRETHRLLDEIIGLNAFRSRQDQNGVIYTTICSSCNNKLGRHDRDLVDFAQKTKLFLESTIVLPDKFDVECRPNSIMRSILGHLLAAKTETDQVVFDSLIRSSITNSRIPIHDDIHVFYWIYPFDETIILRDFCMSIDRTKFKTPGLFNLIKFYPLAFLVAYKVPNYERLLSLHQFNRVMPSEKRHISFNFKDVRHLNFPEDTPIGFGRSAQDSVWSIANPKFQER